jgi:hypothetical protein
VKAQIMPDATEIQKQNNMDITINISEEDYQKLMADHDKNVALIKSIQEEVAGECDNLSNPVPLFQQLATA